MEVSLHAHVGQHPNVIEWFASGEEAIWRWIAMEFAEGGDLFDKIEADVGVHQDIAHLYFRQLVAGVSFMHSKGVAHRDLKPENILLSHDGALKLADFGMATMFEYKGQRKTSATLCGSPPYIAPEILACKRASRYAPDLADLWSCGVILFVLLVGNTPWDEPSPASWEFGEYVRTAGHSSDALWARVPPEALSLLRGIMSVDAARRFGFAQIRQHPWYTRRNPLLASDGGVSDPVGLATQMLESLRIDLSQPALGGSQRRADADARLANLASTQPETPISDQAWDWEQPVLATSLPSRAALGASLADEPSMSQFAAVPGPSMSLTQQARRFRDICPPEPLTRFFSHVPAAHLVHILNDALHQLNVPLVPVSPSLSGGNPVASIKVRAVNGRQQNLHGDIRVDRQPLPEGGEVLDVRFVKIKGDPLE